jgi:diaminohydroxyphosphoribosylaminopyrimidine deaminase/5-amino-6-(5-phosphoribosylamino)uracil reductase
LQLIFRKGSPNLNVNLTKDELLEHAIQVTRLDDRLGHEALIGIVIIRKSGDFIYRCLSSNEVGTFNQFQDVCLIGLTMEPDPESWLTKAIQQIMPTSVHIASPFYKEDIQGRTINLWRQHGIEVTINGNLDAVEINEAFYKHANTGMPTVVASWGMSLDGSIATKDGDSKWISNGDSLLSVHRMRDRMMGIMVGIGTILMDNPQLTTRLPNKIGRHPWRFVLDRQLRIPLESNVVINAKNELGRTTVFCGVTDTQRQRELEAHNVEVVFTNTLDNLLDLNAVLTEIGKRCVTSLLVEGGSRLLGTFNDYNLIDKLTCYISPTIIGGQKSIHPFGGKGISKLVDAKKIINAHWVKMGEDLMFQGHVLGHQPSRWLSKF